MTAVTRAILAVVLLASSALADFHEFTAVPKDPSIESKLRFAAEKTLREFPKLKSEDLAISAVDITHAATIARGDFHGDASFYPASVIKLFFMVNAFARHKESLGDMDRALKEMITVSDNDATAFIVDVTTDTCSGSSLEGRALRKFMERRRTTNRAFARYGYDISAMAKPWSFGPFGRDKQLMGPNLENRNRLTANATASLLLWIVRRRAISAAASEMMMTLLARPLDPLRADENQVKEFIGEALPAGSKLWSKAGWTTQVRHDAAYVELPDGKKLVLVIFTRGTADDVTLLPAITRNVLAEWQ